MTKTLIKIDVASDIVCPWCFIGKRRLERALLRLKKEFNFQVEYHPFELNPDIPDEGVDQEKFLTLKFGGINQYLDNLDRVTSIAFDEGLTFRLSDQKVLPNTRKMHGIIAFAKLKEKHLEVVEAFFTAYFSEGTDLSLNANLIEIAQHEGLNPHEVEKLITSDIALEKIGALEQQLQALGVHSVPFYIINDTYGISGAHPSETFVQIIREVASKQALKDSI